MNDVVAVEGMEGKREKQKQRKNLNETGDRLYRERCFVWEIEFLKRKGLGFFGKLRGNKGLSNSLYFVLPVLLGLGRWVDDSISFQLYIKKLKNITLTSALMQELKR